jgi:hypothetical protein
LSQGYYEEVAHGSNGRVERWREVFRLDTMVAVNLMALDNVGCRHLPKNAGILSCVLVDGETQGSLTVAFAVAPHFARNLTGGAPNTVPAVIVNGMPGAPVRLWYYKSNGSIPQPIDAQIESVNGTITFEIPTDGYVVYKMPITGSDLNSNPEVLLRMGSQPIVDVPGKNWVPASGQYSGGK